MKSRTLTRVLLLTALSALLPLVSVTATVGSSLFVSEQFGNQILRFSSRGTSRFFASVQAPQGMALDAAGNLYVASFEDSIVYRISRDGEKVIFISGNLIGNPTSLAFDSSGNLFVGKAVNPAGIIKVTPDGTASLFASKVEPNGLAVDASDNLFATDLRTNGIYKYTPDGSRTTFATGFSFPQKMAFDSAGNLFVSDITAGTIVEITPGGTRTTFAAGLDAPDGLAFDPKGHLYVTDYEVGNIFKFDPNGSSSLFATGLNTPNDLVVRP
jgi:sugar lactone lactonase YvrE